jgi:hypothetical protein
VGSQVSPAGAESEDPTMVIVDGELYIAYTQANSSDYTQHVYVKKYQSGTWATVGTGPVSAFSAQPL